MTKIVQSYPHGTRPIVTATFTDAAGLGRIASDCIFKLKDPAGVETSYDFGTDASVTNPSTNVFKFELPKLVVDGTWWIRAVATAGFDAPNEIAIFVERSVFTSP